MIFFLSGPLLQILECLRPPAFMDLRYNEPSDFARYITSATVQKVAKIPPGAALGMINGAVVTT